MLDLDRPKMSYRRVRTPTVYQMEAVECGAAALSMVLAYFGRFEPLEGLRAECGVSRDGSRADMMAKVGRAYGLDVHAFSLGPEDCLTLPLPMIVFWQFNHFVVVEGFGRGKVYLNDPGPGRRTISWDEFDRGFTGVVLTFEKTQRFKPGGKPSSLFWMLCERYASYLAPMVYVFFCGLLLVVPGLCAPMFGRVFVDNVLTANMVSWTKPLMLVMASTCLLAVALTWFQKNVLRDLQVTLSSRTASRMVWRLLRLPISFYSQRQVGDLTSRIGASAQVAQLLSGELATTIVNGASATLYLLLMLKMDAAMTAITVAVAAVNIVVLRSVSGYVKEVNGRLQQDLGKLWAYSSTGIRTVETLKATGREADFFSRWAGFQASAMAGQQEVESLNKYLSLVPSFTMALAQTALLSLGGYRVMMGGWSIGSMMAYQIVMSGFFAPLSQLMTLGFSLQLLQANLMRINDIEKNPLDKAFCEPPSPPQVRVVTDSERSSEVEAAVQVSGSIELVDLTFGYNPLLPPLIEGFSLTVSPGSRVAIVGATGSGKSTIVSLLMGLYSPWAGRILLDGKPLDSIPRDLRAEAMAMVTQDIFLFAGTVRDNLTLWNPHISQQAVVEAAQDACIHDAIARRAQGYLSTVGEGGSNFSGGEAQRLEIARALVGRPRILVMDEATSALDAEVEQRIDENLRRRGCTCLIIAHRLSTIRDSDQIVVLEKGKAVEHGKHAELLSSGGYYARLVKAD